MPIPSPIYNPHWKSVHDGHAELREQAQRECDDLHEQMKILYESGEHPNSPLSKDLRHQAFKKNEEMGHHNRDCQQAILTQHATVQDYARWVFHTFDPKMSAWSKTATTAVDFEQFQSLEDVDAAWSDAHQASLQENAENTGNLPVGRPSGLDIFEETGNNRVRSARRVFALVELFPNGHFFFNDNSVCDALVTIDQRDHEYHVCFSQMNKAQNGELHVAANLGALATIIFREAYARQHAKTYQDTPQRKLAAPGFVSAVRGALTRYFDISKKTESDLPKPDQFKFYQHTPAQHLMNERFWRTDMNFRDGAFDDASVDWKFYDALPGAIRKAFDAERGHSATPKNDLAARLG